MEIQSTIFISSGKTQFVFSEVAHRLVEWQRKAKMEMEKPINSRKIGSQIHRRIQSSFVHTNCDDYLLIVWQQCNIWIDRGNRLVLLRLENVECQFECSFLSLSAVQFNQKIEKTKEKSKQTNDLSISQSNGTQTKWTLHVCVRSKVTLHERRRENFPFERSNENDSKCASIYFEAGELKRHKAILIRSWTHTFRLASRLSSANGRQSNALFRSTRNRVRPEFYELPVRSATKNKEKLRKGHRAHECAHQLQLTFIIIVHSQMATIRENSQTMNVKTESSNLQLKMMKL